MNRKTAAVTAMCIALVSTVSCGDTWNEKKEKVERLSNAAYKMIDDDFIGIISNDPSYCLNEDSEEYRSKIMKKYDVDLEWLIVADRGDIKVYYSEDWGSPSYLAGESDNFGNPSLAEIYDKGRKIIEKAKKETETKNVQTTTVTKPVTVTTTTTAKTSDPSNNNVSELGRVQLKTGGDTFTVAAWNSDDVSALLDQWEFNTGYSSGNVDFINFDCGGSDASDRYDKIFISGDDLDVYFVEADWALNFINDASRTAPLETLGFSDANFSNAYDYTMEVGRATEGTNAGKIVGASWQAAAGGFAYRTDLAEQYLGIKTPEEMQAAIGDWDGFTSAAMEVSFQSQGKVAFSDSLGGMWQAFSANRTTPWIVDNSLVVDDFCKNFADIAKVLWENGGVTQNSQWYDGWIDAGKKGSCMGYFVSTWGLAENTFFGKVSAPSYGKWAVVEGPTPYFWGGTWIVVNPATDNADEAQSFIYNATVDPFAMKEYALSKPDFVNNVSVMEEIIKNNETPNKWVTDNLGGQNYFAVLNENIKKIDMRGLITPYDATVKSCFLEVVTEMYVSGGASWEDTVDAFKDYVYGCIPGLS